jgi:hypothetical protein
MSTVDTTPKLSVAEAIITKEKAPQKMSSSAARLAFLWQAYLPAYWYWEVVESTRRIMLTAVLSVSSPGSSKQSVFGVMLAFCYIVLYSTYKPYNEASDATLAESGQIQIFLTFFAALVIQNNLMSSTWDTMLGAMLTLVNMLVIGLTFYFEIAAYQAERKQAEEQAEEDRKKAANDRIAAHVLTKQNPSKTIPMRFERKTEVELLEAMAMEEKVSNRASRKLKKADAQLKSNQHFDEDARGSTVGVELQEWRSKPQEQVVGAPPVFTRDPNTTLNTHAVSASVVNNNDEDDNHSLRLSISDKYRNSRGESFRASVLDYKDSDDEDD